MPRRSVAQVIARICARRGVTRLFGVPGGGSSLDLIRAFAEQGIPFVLARTEAGAAMMAAATAEATGSVGVVVTTQGPGTASVVNGIAHARLDRCPLLLITDGWTPAQAAFDTHQAYDQQGVLAPLVKGITRLDGPDVAPTLETLLEAATTPPWGPVYVELTGATARSLVEDDEAAASLAPTPPLQPDPAELAVIRKMIADADRRVLLVGLEARAPGCAERIAALATRLGCPVLTTYKAKGVLADDHPLLVGLFTGGAAERDCVGAADLILLCGFDPVELIGRPWGYQAPVIDLGPVRHPVHYVKPAASLTGRLPDLLDALDEGGGAGWTRETIAGLRQAMLTRLAYAGSGDGLSPETVVKATADACAGRHARVAVDAGAMMFSAMAFWPAAAPGDVLISNGLASMAFAVPAGIALSNAEPERIVIAFTGDGGLMMCAGELSAAAQHAKKLCIVVFNDAALSLIAIKQKARQLPPEGIDWPRPDFAAVARGFGLRGFSADTPESLRAALAEALGQDGPSLIDARIDPSGYLAQSIALRG